MLSLPTKDTWDTLIGPPRDVHIFNIPGDDISKSTLPEEQFTHGHLSVYKSDIKSF